MSSTRPSPPAPERSTTNGPLIWAHVDDQAPDFIELSDRVWETPELNYQEHRSSAEHLRMLGEQGFRVETGLAGMPTALMGEAGEGGPVIAILGEFDALPELSQEAGASEHRPWPETGQGMAVGTICWAPGHCSPRRR